MCDISLERNLGICYVVYRVDWLASTQTADAYVTQPPYSRQVWGLPPYKRLKYIVCAYFLLLQSYYKKVVLVKCVWGGGGHVE